MIHRLAYILPLFLLSFIVVGCEKDNNEETPFETKERTVIIYMAAENDLDDLNDRESQWQKDYDEILVGAKQLKTGQNLILYVDRLYKTKKPQIIEVTPSGAKTIRTYDSDGYTSDPAVMKEALQWIISKYPAKSYGLVMWGHSDGTGWLIHPKNSAFAKQSRAFMLDLGTNSNGELMWMNIPTYAKVLSSLPHFDYIFFDVCSMMTAEVAYEIRNACDYIIGSPAEVPACGAPYQYVVPDLFLPKEVIGKKIIDDYIGHIGLPQDTGLPMSVVKASKMPAFAQATMEALGKVRNDFHYPVSPNISNCIYYYISIYSDQHPMMTDVRDFMFRNLSTEDFEDWDDVYHQTIEYSVHPSKKWVTTYGIDFSSFTISDDNFGGLSMFIPQAGYSQSDINPNSVISKMQWSDIVDWSQWGWKY